jgi:hypothetical protein
VVFGNTPEEAHRAAQAMVEKLRGWSVVILPSLYYLQLASTVSSAQGPLRRMVKGLAHPPLRVEGDLHFQGTYAAVVDQRMALQQAQFTFLRAQGFRDSGYEGVWWMQLRQPELSTGSLWARARRRLINLRQHVQLTRWSNQLINWGISSASP